MADSSVFSGVENPVPAERKSIGALPKRYTYVRQDPSKRQLQQKKPRAGVPLRKR